MDLATRSLFVEEFLIFCFKSTRFGSECKQLMWISVYAEGNSFLMQKC